MYLCPHCQKEINPGAILGAVKSPAKAIAARLNGSRGFTPRQAIPASKAQQMEPEARPLAVARAERAPLLKSNGKF